MKGSGIYSTGDVVGVPKKTLYSYAPLLNEWETITIGKKSWSCNWMLSPFWGKTSNAKVRLSRCLLVKMTRTSWYFIPGIFLSLRKKIQNYSRQLNMANQAHLEILKQGVTHWNSWRIEEGDTLPDLRKADLHGLNLSNYDLSLCRMEGAVLSKAKLKRTDLRAADLTDADLSECLLEGAYLIEARLTRTNLSRAYLKQANLSDSDLIESCLKEADLTEANLYSANLKSTDLQGASLCSANLIEARFLHTVLEGVEFSHSNLYETLFLNVELDKVQGLDR
ncbi:MAG TPA: pentapeptide repeat-containing protein, partial [Verrucomicrobia bacterium]|nr:pentapeptide repeat-containing protein [Verrucomicrobiota bacterium]